MRPRWGAGRWTESGLCGSAPELQKRGHSAGHAQTQTAACSCVPAGLRIPEGAHSGRGTVGGTQVRNTGSRASVDFPLSCSRRCETGLPWGGVTVLKGAQGLQQTPGPQDGSAACRLSVSLLPVSLAPSAPGWVCPWHGVASSCGQWWWTPATSGFEQSLSRSSKATS